MTIPEISLNVAMLRTEGMTYPQKCFRQAIGIGPLQQLFINVIL
jgi:hypothetical protein